MKASLALKERLGEKYYSFGAHIKALRMCDGIKGTDFARKLGITRQELSRIEKDQMPVSPRRAAAIAEVLGYGADPEIFIELALKSRWSDDEIT